MDKTLLYNSLTIFLALNLILHPLTTNGLPDEEEQASDIFNEQVLLNK